MNDGFRRFFPLIVAFGAALTAAGHVYANLGDYTAERGILALGKTALMALAFGAMAWLVIETALETFSEWLQIRNVDAEPEDRDANAADRQTPDKTS
jgi:hypothetical protein